VKEHEQIKQRQKNTAGKGMRPEPACAPMGNGTNQALGCCAPETTQLAQEYAEGVG